MTSRVPTMMRGACKSVQRQQGGYVFHLESSREVEDRMLELAPRANRQFRRSTSSPDRAILSARRRQSYGHLRCQRGGASWPAELRAREGVKIGLGKIDRGQSWHPRNDRGSDLKLGCDWGRRDLVNLLFWERQNAPGPRCWHSQTTDRDRSGCWWGF